MMVQRPVAVVAILSGLLAARAGWAGEPAKVDYNRAIRPILSNACFQCHGPDENERKAELRLDVRDDAVAPAESGKPAIMPGKPEESGLVRRIFAAKPGVVMPPPKSHKTLTDAERALLKTWIAQGADYQTHWAFVPPRRPEPPSPRNAEWARNAIDRFVLARLEAEGLGPSPEADRATLLRRLTLDLTGLPPTPAEVDAFVADGTADAYEKAVDRLLGSPHFGERMAVDWLDAARFADTHGYHIDSGRDMSRWRAWVIGAYNRNLPFDRFTVEQLAGDLLPGAGVDEKVASGFNRNHMINFEGGAIPQEYHTAYIIDRVNTTATVWLGLTVACAQCHDHKYDPITQKDYYKLYAFFYNVPENGLDGSKGNAAPVVRLPSDEQKAELERLGAEIARLEAKPDRVEAELEALRKRRSDFEAKLPTAMVMEEMAQPREAFVLMRGQYDKPGEKVSAGTPGFLPPAPEGTPGNRLGLARWLVDPGHPLTARVAVNRYWQMVFGTGLVKTSEDFGSQGEPPSHPELLDWLAAEFMDPTGGAGAHRWDVKGILKQIVMSATYRQASAAAPGLFARDPENRLLARGPRLRLGAEAIRDQALAVSGLLRHRVGGPSVSPYQPSGLWEELMSREDGANWSAQTYVQSHGDDLYRRTMYTFWKRTSPPASLATLDAPDRETCTVRRSRTNTPLQALVLLNDPTYVEAARKLAERMMAEGGATADERIAFAFRLATARRPTDDERGVLRALFEAERDRFRGDAAAALKLLAVGEAPRDPALDPAELAAWTMVGEAVLNLDETLTKG